MKPWTAAEIALLGTESDSRVAKKLGRTVGAVAWARREKAGIVRPPTVEHEVWARPESVALLGTMPDAALAELLCVSYDAVYRARVKRGIKGLPVGRRLDPDRWPPEAVALLGTMPDNKLAKQLGIVACAVSAARRRRGIKAFSKGQTKR